MAIKVEPGSATSARPGKRGIIIAHICNNVGAWGAGFVLALDELSSVPKAAYLGLAKDCNKSITLGNSQFVEVQPTLFVCNMIAQNGINKSNKSKCLVDYDALRNCLRTTFERAARLEYDVHLPSGMGSGLAGGDKSKIHKIVQETADEIENSLPAALGLKKMNITLWEFSDKSARSYVQKSISEKSGEQQTVNSGLKTDEISELG